MTTKRGQVTVFIIIGIILLIIIGAVFYFVRTGSQVDVSDEVVIDTSSLQNFVASCAKQTAQDAVVYTGERGGLFTGLSDVLPYSSEYHIYEGIAIPYYYYEGQNTALSEADITNALNTYMQTYLSECTSGFEVFRQQGYDVNEGEIVSNAIITEESVLFDIEYPITLRRDGSSQTEDRFSTEVSTDVRNSIEAVYDYLDAQEGNPNAFRLQHLVDICWENSLRFDAVDRGNGNVVVTLVDDNSLVKGNPFQFSFAVKYDWTSPE
ncbi:hypothetical protein GF345_00450 [Candidatus Woesearchaeota archaeon]|nr:hypothetical protein [Candidatus Woesearchaeota archaeon]